VKALETVLAIAGLVLALAALGFIIWIGYPR
jgi:hypothetical protein